MAQSRSLRTTDSRALADQADIVIPTFRIREASEDRRQPHPLWSWRRGARRPGSGAGTSARLDPLTDAAQPPKRAANLEAAAELVAALAKENSGSDISKRTITRALERAFGSVQSSEWFGCGAYRDFIRKAVVLRCDLSVRPAKGGGVSVRYRAAKPQKEMA